MNFDSSDSENEIVNKIKGLQKDFAKSEMKSDTTKATGKRPMIQDITPIAP